MRVSKTNLIYHLTLGLVLYLLLFSAFALYHAYADNELSDPHGCPIGLWLLHGQVIILAVVLFSAVLARSFYYFCVSELFLRKLFASCLTARAPPLSSCL
jgi:hypothetical protein